MPINRFESIAVASKWEEFVFASSARRNSFRKRTLPIVLSRPLGFDSRYLSIER